MYSPLQEIENSSFLQIMKIRFGKVSVIRNQVWKSLYQKTNLLDGVVFDFYESYFRHPTPPWWELVMYLYYTYTLHICAQYGTERIPKKGLRWNPSGKRKQGRPKMTLRKTFEEDLKKMELTWGTAEREAKERRSWRKRSSCIILNG